MEESEPTMGVMKVSQSKIKLWRKCRQAYDYKYVQKLRPKVKSRPLQFGSIVHKMLEAHADGDDPFETLDLMKLPKMFDEELELYKDMLQDIRYLMTDYFSYYRGADLVYLRLNKKNSEHEFEIELEPGIVITGKIDAFAKQQRKKLRWLVEHKTFKRAPSEDHRWRNIQSAVYLTVNDLLGFPFCDGVCWDYLNNKPLSKPKVLKNGSLSKAKIVTLPSVVRDFMKKNNLSTTHYKSFIEQVEQSVPDHFFRVYSPVSKSVRDKVFNDFLKTARDIAEHHGEDNTKCIDLHCDYCEYEDICRAELQNLDVDYVIKRGYTHADEDEEKQPVIAEAD